MIRKVYITDYIANPDLERKVLGDLLVSTPQEDVAVLLVWHQKIDAAYMNRFPRLKGVVRYGVGFDSIDLECASSRGVVVCNTPDYGTDEVSDTALAMILSQTRGLYLYDLISRNLPDNWQENTLKMIKRTSEITLGILGAGRIGGSVLLKARALGFRTVFFDPYKPSGHEKMLGSKRTATMDELLVCSDIISIHVPLSGETRGIINSSFVGKMKKGASLVNTARGGLFYDIDTLYEPLKSGHLHQVFLDVLPEEPPRQGRLINAWLKRESWLDGRLLINPHTAYYSNDAYREMRSKASANALRILNGEMPLNIVSI